MDSTTVKEQVREVSFFHVFLHDASKWGLEASPNLYVDSDANLQWQKISVYAEIQKINVRLEGHRRSAETKVQNEGERSEVLKQNLFKHCLVLPRHKLQCDLCHETSISSLFRVTNACQNENYARDREGWRLFDTHNPTDPASQNITALLSV